MRLILEVWQYLCACNAGMLEAKDFRGVLTHLPPGQYWLPFQTFQMHFHQWKKLYFDLNFFEVCANWQKVSIVLGDGLALNRQAITWPNVDWVHKCIYAALVGHELSYLLSKGCSLTTLVSSWLIIQIMAWCLSSWLKYNTCNKSKMWVHINIHTWTRWMIF